MRLIDAAKTQAVLVGISKYDADESLHDLPAAKTNVDTLEKVLASSTVGINKENITTLHNAGQPQEILKVIKTAAQNASKSLVIYYSGHGILDEDFNLYLSTSESKVEDIFFTGVSIDAINRVIQKERLLVVLILDACFSEKAFEQFRKTNFYVLASSKKNTPSKYPPAEEYSAFTSELINILENGINIRKTELALRDIYLQLEKNLTSKGFPQPRQANTNLVQELIFAKNNSNTVVPSTQLNRNIILPVFYAVAKYRNIQIGTVIENDLDIENPFAEDELSAYFEDDEGDTNYSENLQLTQKANQIVRYFPLFIAEELKRLFAPSPSEQERNLGRINQILRTYFSTMRYICYLLLAELWDEKVKSNIPISSTFQSLFKEIDNPTPSIYLPLIEEVVEIFLQNGKTPYISELTTWKKEFEQDNFKNAYLSLESLYQNWRTQAATWNIEKVEENCLEAENHLTTILEQLAFLAKYELISIRSIRVIKLKNRDANFVHSLNHLFSDTNQSGQIKKEPLNFYTDSHSVCITKQTNLENEILNLSPLFFDKNTYTNNIPSIYFYERKDSITGGYSYRPTFSRDVAAEPLASTSGDIRLLELFEAFKNSLS
ncbi:caspase family protein [Bernardetia sp.]|uniref:caspase family protein n=1 Tax=Bernardetia sp. TaxID=1937974 RepID=UPI0025C0F32C|nr:caspase family protein [Bernardetia sp.]